MRCLFMIFVTVALLSMAAGTQAADHKFIGAAGCKMCHKGVTKGSQFEIWESSRHSKTVETLKSEAAVKIGKEKGLKVPPSEAAECLKCHTTGHGAPAALFDAKFDKNAGVQCEACHGAGGDYKSLTVMKDRQKSIDAGMNPIAVADGSAEKHCVKCHNSENPTFKGFNFKEYWEKIKHPKPAANLQ